MLPPSPRAKTEYKKPRRINSVSLVLAAIFGAMIYVAYAFWPVYMLRAKVKSELEDVLPNVYQLNLRPDSVSRPELVKIKRLLVERIRKAGVTDKKLTVEITRSKKKVGAEAHFTATAAFPGWKTKVYDLAPRAETDAARVEW
jgi:hypothetical protein